MSASKDQSALGSTGQQSFGPDSNSGQKGTSWESAGSTTASGAGPHPKDNADDSGVTPSSTKVGPQQDDLEGNQTATFGEGDVAHAQEHKAGFGEEQSLTSDLDRKKAEQKEAREEIKSERQAGQSVDGSGGGRKGNESISDA
jgi:hypothetical protein